MIGVTKLEEDKHFKILQEFHYEFVWIKIHSMKRQHKLKELVDLRNFLKEYQLFSEEVKIDDIFYEKISSLVNEIDNYWWIIFRGKG